MAYRVLLVLCSIIFLESCSPVYSTQYTYYPISGREGQICSNTCLVGKQDCVQAERLNSQNCESQANLQYTMCLNAKVYGYNSDGDWVCLSNCYCPRIFCNAPNFSFCEENYKTCYLNCGGDVAATTSCVRNCDEANPPTTQRLRLNEHGSVVDVTGEAF